MFERPGPSFVTGFGGLSLILPTVFLLFCIFVQKISNDKNKIRNGLFLLLGFIIICSFLVIVNENSNFLSMPSYRYLNAINPFLTTLDPLTDSVAEHATTTTALSFFFNSILMIFAGLGVWIILSKKISKTGIIVKNDMKAFMLIIGITSVYISSAFIRLELFASISLIILASVGLSILTKEIFQIKYFGKKNYALKTSYFVIILFLFLIPLVYPTQNWISVADSPPTILNGGTTYPVSSDWLEALEWIKLNTPVDSVIASWWD
jgi:dolichyl-diphosphooligosaccharide--protein glycosyltransferase